MNPTNPRSAEEIFQAAADLPEGEREDFVAAQCAGDPALRADVESLLHHLERAGTGFLARPAFDPRMGQDFEVPERIGHYRIVRRLGEGGMGVVFEAEQTSPRRRVALKVIRPGLHGPDVRRRFEFEAEVLARLRHPFIAHVYDAGVLEVGRDEGIAIPLPYFAMELVRGEAIDVWVRERDGSIAVVLELMAKVADAVESAHQRGVIHRDLKPANVVVDEHGDPKVLDFGLARAVDPLASRTLHTGAGTILGTLPYISPEQMEGDPSAVDTRTDVYSLGVILLELLIGAPPIDVARLPLPEAIRKAREEPLPRPSQRRLRVNDELDTIVRRATAREPDRRYASAGALAEDLRRYLRGDPLEAKRDSGWYVARKQIRRHRLAFAVALSFVVVLVAASIVVLGLYVRAEGARRVATEQLWMAQLQQARAARASDAVGRRFRSLEAIAAAARMRPDRALRDEAVACMVLDDLALEREIRFEGLTASARGLRHIDRVAELFESGVVRVRSLEESSVESSFELPAPDVAPRRPSWSVFDAEGDWLAVQHLEERLTRLRVWDLRARSVAMEIDGANFVGRVFAFGRTKEAAPLLVVADDRGEVRSFDLPSGATRAMWQGPPSPVRLTAGAGGRRVVLSSRATAQVFVFDSASLAVEQQLDNEEPAYALALEDTGRRLVTGGRDHVVRVFDVERGQKLLEFHGHQAAVVEAGIVEGSDLAVTGSWDQTVRFWDLQRGREAFAPLKSVEYSSVSEHIVLKHPAGKLDVWRHERGAELARLDHDADLGAPVGAVLSHDGRTAYTAGAPGVAQWNVDTATLTRRVYDGVAHGLAIDEEVGIALVSVEDGVIELDLRGEGSRSARSLVEGARYEEVVALGEGWVAASREQVSGFDREGHVRAYLAPTGATSVNASRDGRWLFVGTWRGDPAHLLDLTTDRVVRRFAGPHVRGAFDPEGRWLAVVDGEDLRVFDLADLDLVHHAPRGYVGNGLAGAVEFSPDGALLAVGLDPYRVELYETGSFRSVLTLPNPDFTNIARTCFSGDGTRLLVAGSGARAAVWDLGRVRAGLRSLGLDWAPAAPSIRSAGSPRR